jgi:hypothetical protein
MPQIIINTKGGLGNILFQLAAGLNFAKKFNLGLVITSQPNSRKSFREYTILKKFNKFFVDYNKIKEYLVKFNRYILKINEKNYIKSIKMYDIKNNRNIYLNGYFQNKVFFQRRFDYFKSFINLNYRERIENELHSINKILIGLHIRLGDYLNHTDIFNITSKQYYIKCLNKIFEENLESNMVNSNIEDHIEVLTVEQIFKSNILNQLNQSKIKIIVFTDNPNFVKKNYIFLNKYQTIYADDLIDSNSRLKNINLSKEEIEFMMMQLCDQMICSNSTYSLFATYLGNNKKVYIPDQWFNNKIVNSTKYIMKRDKEKYQIC